MLEEVDTAVSAVDFDVAERSTVVDRVVCDRVGLATFLSATCTELDCAMTSLVEEGRTKEKVPWVNELEVDEVYTTLFNGAAEVPAADELSTAWEG